MKSPRTLLVSAFSLLLALSASAREQPMPESLPAGQNMYVIERVIPDAGKKTPDELKAISQKSCAVLRSLGPRIQWVHSYVTGDKIYCVYIAPSEELVRQHAKEGGFPANAVTKVSTIISPTTAGQ